MTTTIPLDLVDEDEAEGDERVYATLRESVQASLEENIHVSIAGKSRTKSSEWIQGLSTAASSKSRMRSWCPAFYRHRPSVASNESVVRLW
ncbi:MAG TPA: hypothetical protein VLK65_15405 [Vicinamibacteria bacterium]|nr:hypothetical protein [Vicinamibacteria bacterium]